MMLLRSGLPLASRRCPASTRFTNRLTRQPLTMLAAMLIAMAAVLSGCFEAEIPAPSATVSPMTSEIRPAKGPNCPLQVLHTMPEDDVKQLALIDTWGDEVANDAD